MIHVVNNFQGYEQEGYAFYRHRESPVWENLLILGLLYSNDPVVGGGHKIYLGTFFMLCLLVSYFFEFSLDSVKLFVP